MKVMFNQKDSLKGQVTVEFKPGGCFPPARLALGRIQLSNHQVITSVVVWVMIGTILHSCSRKFERPACVSKESFHSLDPDEL